MQGSQLLEDFVSNTVLNVQNVRPRPTSHSQPMNVTEYSFFQKYVSYIKIHEQETFIYQLSLWTIFVCLIIHIWKQFEKLGTELKLNITKSILIYHKYICFTVNIYKEMYTCNSIKTIQKWPGLVEIKRVDVYADKPGFKFWLILLLSLFLWISFYLISKEG